jgi:lipoate-protein ligase A
LHGTARLKVPGGKLISVRVDYGNTIESVQILGDFFVHPEEAVADIEEALKGSGTKESRQATMSRIDRVVKRRHAELIGITPSSIAEAVALAIDNGAR